MAGLPVLAGNIPTLETYVQKYQVGLTADPDDPQSIAAAMRKMVDGKKQLEIWRKNCIAAAQELNWEKEAEKMRKIYEDVLDSME